MHLLELCDAVRAVCVSREACKLRIEEAMTSGNSPLACLLMHSRTVAKEKCKGSVLEEEGGYLRDVSKRLGRTRHHAQVLHRTLRTTEAPLVL